MSWNVFAPQPAADPAASVAQHARTERLHRLQHALGQPPARAAIIALLREEEARRVFPADHATLAHHEGRKDVLRELLRDLDTAAKPES